MLQSFYFIFIIIIIIIIGIIIIIIYIFSITCLSKYINAKESEEESKRLGWGKVAGQTQTFTTSPENKFYSILFYSILFIFHLTIYKTLDITRLSYNQI